MIEYPSSLWKRQMCVWWEVEPCFVQWLKPSLEPPFSWVLVHAPFFFKGSTIQRFLVLVPHIFLLILLDPIVINMLFHLIDLWSSNEKKNKKTTNVRLSEVLLQLLLAYETALKLIPVTVGLLKSSIFLIFLCFFLCIFANVCKTFFFSTLNVSLGIHWN